ncbi:HEAT repeat domain-containing protein [Lachnoclostridium sp. MSJ-17]|uniref:HEAT repeat domain-containing protein n=1 Tax=Lachnoclostridium sp. MSJ-17 TaxID=2841516 RepID=UPI001C11E891|nr:HEAT repeat domain-containing protein [Lachnoclostridium sp. MSJ-17]MBU5461972.1 HEAT repeat domain-containing protein [Lachnoclostridium sp. MSJ-17]
MDAFEILKDKSIKKLEARKLIIDLINSGSFSSDDFFDRADELNEKQTATFLEAVESITGQKESCLGIEYLRFAERYILSANNSCKREASRVVGNMAALYPDELDGAIDALLKNTSDSGTVVRWGSAYALARIVVLERYKGSGLVDTVREIYESEQESGVKNQYAKALRRIKAM